MSIYLYLENDYEKRGSGFGKKKTECFCVIW